MRERPRSSPRAAPREERIAAQIAEAEPAGDAGGSSSCAGWPRTRSLAERRPRRPPGSARALAEPPPPASEGEVLLELSSAELRLGAPEAVDHLSGGRRADPGAGAAHDLGPPARRRAHLVGRRGPARRGDRDGDRVGRARRTASWRCCSKRTARRTPSRPASRPAPRWRGGSSAHGDLAGATPGERLVLASLAFERARASESATRGGRRTSRARSPAAAS